MQEEKIIEKIDYVKRAHNVVNPKGEHVPYGQAIYVGHDDLAHLVTVNISMTWCRWELWESSDIPGSDDKHMVGEKITISIHLEGGISIFIDVPERGMYRLTDQDERHIRERGGHYLRADSNVSVSRIRPYGVGIEMGDVTTRAIRLAELTNMLSNQTSSFFRKPEFKNDLTSEGDGVFNKVKFHARPTFKKDFDQPLNDLPIYREQSLAAHCKVGNYISELIDPPAFLRKQFPYSQIRVENLGRKDGTPVEYILEDVHAGCMDTFHVIDRQVQIEEDRFVDLYADR